jgi:hypothetical protein
MALARIIAAQFAGIIGPADEGFSQSGRGVGRCHLYAAVSAGH